MRACLPPGLVGLLRVSLRSTSCSAPHPIASKARDGPVRTAGMAQIHGSNAQSGLIRFPRLLALLTYSTAPPAVRISTCIETSTGSRVACATNRGGASWMQWDGSIETYQRMGGR
ncbi:hypothetical protein K458DRAFT_89176 [Lentithecium fluviatile CBS 122367]|uniref:Uncharacterized protein n=1 Tax=Lentithecium fluviatile CBS 122367 TaxID=1168545 RepID=A0A6G1IRK6_9PLEO|nr:hypothetical protein K458DRAFT_89176 [Lentithecium fluviatile CBS 122367]